MKISLTTVSFNAGKTISDALRSVWTQKVPVGVEIDYIVVDGGSSDGTVERIRAFDDEVRAARRGGFRFRWTSERDRGLYDAMNKGIRQAEGEVIGLLNADDVLAANDVLARVAAAFENDPSLDGTYGDIRFVKEFGGPTVRYCSGRWFRPWMFRFGTQVAHPSSFFRRSCFDRWGFYSLDYGMYGDFELLLRFIWKNRARMRYLPLCTTVMRTGGASTDGWRTTVRINQADLRSLRDNGCRSCYLFLYARYLFKIWGFVGARLRKVSQHEH